MLTVIWRIMRKEVLQATRDRRMLGIIFIAPILQTVLFGYAVSLDLKHQPTVIADLDHTPTSRTLAELLRHHDGLSVVGSVDSHRAAEQAVLDGQAAVALLLPRGLEHDMELGQAELLLVLDGSDSNTALRAGQETSQILNYRAIGLQQAKVRELLAARGLAADRLLPELAIEGRAWFNPALRSALYFVPAVFALVLMVITMLLTSMGLTREREIGTLEQIMVTPVRPLELMVGKTLPFAVLGLVDVGVIIAVAAVLFGVPVHGSLLALYFATLLFLMTTLGLGLFISTISATQQQAMMTAFFFILPALMLSGYVFPIANMPEPVQWLTTLNPLRYYIELTRGIMVKGATLTELWRSVAGLFGLGTLVLLGAAARFHKRVT